MKYIQKDAGELMRQAARAHHYGLSRAKAIAAVTSVPADAIGLGHRVGRLQIG